jgi:hypothetical protein
VGADVIEGDDLVVHQGDSNGASFNLKYAYDAVREVCCLSD